MKIADCDLKPGGRFPGCCSTGGLCPAWLGADPNFAMPEAEWPFPVWGLGSYWQVRRYASPSRGSHLFVRIGGQRITPANSQTSIARRRVRCQLVVLRQKSGPPQRGRPFLRGASRRLLRSPKLQGDNESAGQEAGASVRRSSRSVTVAALTGLVKCFAHFCIASARFTRSSPRR